MIKYYGGDSSLQLGSFKLVMVSTPDAVKEVLLKKSVTFAGRPQLRSYSEFSLGRLSLSDYPQFMAIRAY